MRIALDLTSVPPRLAGVGHYLVALVDALQTVDGTNEYVLFTSAARAGVFPLRSPRFRIAAVPERGRTVRILWEQLQLPGLLPRLGVDVLHSPHYTRPLRRLPCASVVGVMDLTYFLMPDHHTWARRVFFRRMLPAAAARADRIIAISESTKRDAERLLGVPGERIDAIPLAVSDAYRSDIPAEEIEAVRRRLNLPREYILFVGTIEPRKNLLRLLRAYAEAARAEPGIPDLVIAGMRGWQTSAFDRAVAATGLAGRIRIAGYVPEEDLPCVYAGALMFVYPSLYEGFGIPVLEALACGVPTITSRASSMPEVAGDAAILVDPHDTGAIAAAMLELDRDGALRDRLRREGPVRAAAFSWLTTARLTVAAYERTFQDWQRRALRGTRPNDGKNC